MAAVLALLLVLLSFGYCLAALAAFVIYAVGPAAIASVGFLASVVHWPARVLRAVHLTGWLDAPCMALADGLVAAAGAHRWMPGAGMLLFLGTITWLFGIYADKLPKLS